MYKADVLAKFSKEIQDLAQRGVYTLFESKDGNDLLVMGNDSKCFLFNNKGVYLTSTTSSSINFSKYNQLETTSFEHVDSIFNILRTT